MWRLRDRQVEIMLFGSTTWHRAEDLVLTEFRDQLVSGKTSLRLSPCGRILVAGAKVLARADNAS